MYENQQIHLQLYNSSVTNTYIFRSPIVTNFWVYSIIFGIQQKNLCVEIIPQTLICSK